MNITNIKVKLTGDDLLSIFNEFINIEGIKIEKILINDEISITGILNKGFNINFQISIKLNSYDNGVIAAEIVKLKILNLGIASFVRKLALKYVLKTFKEKGIVYNNGKVEIEYRYILKDIPYIDFHINNLYCLGEVVSVELKDIVISTKGLLNKEVGLIDRSKKEEAADEDEEIIKVKDCYTVGRNILEEKLPEKVKSYSDYVFILPDLINLIYRLLKDKRVPVKTKTVISAAIAYIAVPSDLIPDKIPFVGKIDDLAVVFFAIDRIIQDVPTKVILENWQGKNNIITVLKTLVEYITGFTGAKNIEYIYNIIDEIATV